VSRSQALIIAAAILGGSAIISVGLYAGLAASRDAPAQASAPPAALSGAPALAIDPGPRSPDPQALVRGASPPAWAQPPALPAPPSPPPPSLTKVRQKAADDVTRFLQADRWRYAERCWSPALQKHPAASPSSFVFNIAFDADGREIARGIGTKGTPMTPNSPGFAEFQSDPTQQARLEVHRCLMAIHDQQVFIAPPGRNIDVTVALQIP
jgi:hypothetical protein